MKRSIPDMNLPFLCLFLCILFLFQPEIAFAKTQNIFLSPKVYSTAWSIGIETEANPFYHTTTLNYIFAWGSVNMEDGGLGAGNWVGAFVDDVEVNDGCIGAYQITEKGYYGAMTLYGDDPTTPEKEGAAENDRIIFKAYLTDEARTIPMSAIGPDDAIWKAASELLTINLTEETVILHAVPTSGCAPLTVVFEAETTGISDPSQSWDFGDGNSSTEIDPVHVYDNPGLYTATLTMTNDAGSPVQRSVNIEVKAFCYTTTLNYIFAWGSVNMEDGGLGAGNWVGAFVDDVEVNDGCIGAYQITEKGYYGAMTLYGDDPTTPEKEGAAENDRIIFKAYLTDEARMIPMSPTGPDDPIWKAASELLTINLVSSVKQEIPLCHGWNLISFQINNCYYEGTSPTAGTHPVFIPQGVKMVDLGASNDSMEAWLSNDTNSPLRDVDDPNKAGKWQRITSFDSNGGHIMDKDLPPFINTLKYISAGYGYWIKMNAPGKLVLEGQFVSAGTPLELQYRWNLIGYIPNDTCYADIDQNDVCPYKSGVYTPGKGIVYCPIDPLVPSVLTSIDGKYRRITSFDCCAGGMIYDIQLPPMINTLHYIGPKYGYWIKIEDPEGAELIFPENCASIQ